MGTTSNRCDVVWLTWVRNGPVVGESNALACNPLQICCSNISFLLALG